MHVLLLLVSEGLNEWMKGERTRCGEGMEKRHASSFLCVHLYDYSFIYAPLSYVFDLYSCVTLSTVSYLCALFLPLSQLYYMTTSVDVVIT